MVNLRLPHHAGMYAGGVPRISLKNALNQPQWFIEGKVLVPKTQTIIHSANVIFFYVDRRFKAVNYSLMNRPYMFTGLPQTLTGLDSINETAVEFEYGMQIGNDHFDLRSVLFCEVNTIDPKVGTKVITGCSAGFIVKPTPENGIMSDEFYMYDPQGAGFLHKLPDGTISEFAPIVGLREVGFGPGPERAFLPLSQLRGTVFMYVKSV
jgi:hypothetical protein